MQAATIVVDLSRRKIWEKARTKRRHILLMNSRGMATHLMKKGKEHEVESKMVDINTMRWSPK